MDVITVGLPYPAITRAVTREIPLGDWLSETYTYMNGETYTRRERNKRVHFQPLNT